MCQSPDSRDLPDPPDTTRRAVRRNALWAAGSAAIMLYFGLGAVAPEGTTSSQHVGWMALVYALQFGGGLMIVSALWSLLGIRSALAFDAAACLLIGITLIVSGGLILSGNAQQAVLNLLFGGIFMYSGKGNWSEYGSLGGVDGAVHGAVDGPTRPGEPAEG